MGISIGWGSGEGTLNLPISLRFLHKFPTNFQQLTAPFYTATIFSSALLLFAVQPMLTKMVLPKLGGSPSVWAVSMCFFQGALLLGYCYAFVLNRMASVRGAVCFTPWYWLLAASHFQSRCRTARSLFSVADRTCGLS